MSTSNNSGERTYHRAYANPTEDQAIANVMREQKAKQKKVKRQTAEAQRNRRGYHPGGVWHAEE